MFTFYLLTRQKRKMAVSEGILLASKFRGCLVGALLGDCLGAPYEACSEDDEISKPVLQKYFDKLEGPYFKGNPNPIRTTCFFLHTT